MNHSEIVEALAYLAPKGGWTLSGDDYNDLIWLADGNPPTLAEVEAEIAKIPARKEQARAEAKAKRQALLDKLGITEEEARLLLGGN